MFWREYRRRPSFPVRVPFPCMSLAGEAVQNKHRSSAPENIRLGSTAKARHTPLLDRRKQACFMLTRPGRCVPGAAPAGWTTPAGGASVCNLITCAVCSLSGVAWGESPLSFTTSWPGHYDSQAFELDIQAATRGGVGKKASGQ